jgi:hypothetical protein
MFSSVGPEYEFCGYRYAYEIHEDGDDRTSKLWHDVIDSRGNRVPLKYTNDWSAYRYPTEEQFQNAVLEYMLTEYFKKEKHSVGF